MGASVEGWQVTAPRMHRRIETKACTKRYKLHTSSLRPEDSCESCPKMGCRSGCAEEGMCLQEYSTCLHPQLVKEQRALHSQGGSGGTRGLGQFFLFGLLFCMTEILKGESY